MTNETEKFDFLILGGGSAGYAAARTAHNLGKRVAVVDGAAELSGLCILRGCMPSKTLIYSAEVLHLAQQGDVFGFKGGNPVADMQAMQQRKREVIREFSEYRKEQLEDGRFSLFKDYGHFRDLNSVELSDGKILRAEKILISTGSIIKTPDLPGLRGCSFKTSDDVLDLNYLPEECIVLGGGVVACELAQFLARVGCRVVQLQRSPYVLKEFAQASSKTVAEALRDNGINLMTNVSLKSFEDRPGERVRVNFEHEGESKTLETKFLFNALGRQPATASLGVDKVGLELRSSGHLVANEYQQTNVSHIYAAGDCTGPHEIVHVAIRQGETVAKHAFGQSVNPMTYDSLLTVVFTDPQIARVGLSQEQMTKRGCSYTSASFPFDDHGKSILMEAKRGYVAVHADKNTGRILGAECASRDAGELIHSMSVAVGVGATVHDMLKADWYHPTLSEIWTYPLEDLAEEITPSKPD
ncbi:NAD(P)/FAD-dependent oxidoreductase [Opitutales bacterium]|nr:NAD(P)/FAD-dependent oxidoreductase [Opitutales bacterium]